MFAARQRTPTLPQPAPRQHFLCRNQTGGGQRTIRQYIESECPLPGLDRRYREQPREATVEFSLLPADRVLPPGSRYALRLNAETWQSVIADNGQVITVPFTEKSGATTGKALNKGSFACLCQVSAAQTIGQVTSVTVVAQERVLVQAVAPTADPAVQRAQAAPLPDRWIYYVRAPAVEDLAEATSSATGGTSGHTSSQVGPEVHTALRDCIDAADEVLRLMQHMAELMARLCGGDGGNGAGEGGAGAGGVDGSLVLQAETEWDELLHWVGHVASSGGGEGSGARGASAGAGTGVDASSTGAEGNNVDSDEPCSRGTVEEAGTVSAQHKLRLASRLSYAPFAAVASPQVLGCSEQEVGERGRKAMQMTDMGVRLEAAAEYLQLLKDKASAQLMLRQLRGA